MHKGARPVLSVNQLSKAFSGKTVVKDVTFELYPGEILALVGENGAGKSTTKNMLCGLLTPTLGQIFVEGEEVPEIQGVEQGISAVHQELSLFPSLTVAENLCINDLPGSALNVDWHETQRLATEQLAFLGVEIDILANVESLGAGKQQIVEIAKASMHANKILILDEPTTSLTVPEREKLFSIMRMLKERGVAMIFISHFMDEVYAMADKFVALRDGTQVGTGYLKDVPRRELEALMVGRAIGESAFDLHKPSEKIALSINNLSSHRFDKVSLAVASGEILGIAGLMGAGRTELVESIFGIRAASGDIYIDNEQVSPASVSKMKKKGVVYVTEDRRKNGMFSGRSVKENSSAAGLSYFVKQLVKGLGFSGEREAVARLSQDMNVSTPSIDASVRQLSGGNQQKVLLGRWLATKPKICILDEPTKGVDIGAKFEIHKKIVAFAKQGVAVIVVSSDLQELLDVSHRIMVMRTGHMVGEFERENFDAVKIISLAASSVHEQSQQVAS
ncbi:sugar ABC transporter ATP-binding protein [Paraglaciecola aquimarina]|uniref:Sugar ABC transporter ATP-binding protein n=1 Tax=Paraglaciecola algarum TaxID=3050085 RepID=A0ABS9D3M3_9ALTE|nr:sugar ABC transporter ATP-binding protein [Paraglaciecola sp. G1-23]MCF2946643.1 sugar ABC transporter ATP-binding protein [Paraglaciecola sp. G1-23]